MKTNESIKQSKLCELLESITVYNWYCGYITALYAFSNDCVVENASDQAKVRRLLKANGYVAHFNCGILSIKY